MASLAEVQGAVEQLEAQLQTQQEEANGAAHAPARDAERAQATYATLKRERDGLYEEARRLASAAGEAAAAHSGEINNLQAELSAAHASQQTAVSSQQQLEGQLAEVHAAHTLLGVQRSAEVTWREAADTALAQEREKNARLRSRLSESQSHNSRLQIELDAANAVL